jgi:hypothetical protein
MRVILFRTTNSMSYFKGKVTLAAYTSPTKKPSFILIAPISI